MEMTREYFFIREKAVKTWGLTGQNGGRGEFFVVPHCALQPHYGGGTTDARVSVYCSLAFFARTQFVNFSDRFTVFLTQ